jgi:3-oxoacyl-[acyl-carrier protein] reductase
MRLPGTRALVTGAGRGIGRAIAEAFVREGARVLGVARSESELVSLAAAFPSAITTARIDVTDRSQVDRLPALVDDALGGLDVLVNNAGVWLERPFLELTREDWDRTLATNLTAVFDVTRALLPALLRSPSARIVNVAAIDGEKGFPKLVAQCASKAGVIGFTRALAKELWNAPVTVNAICPAEVDKEIEYAKTPARSPGPARALPWDVARAAVYLASEEGVRISGACLDVHGIGFLAS